MDAQMEQALGHIHRSMALVCRQLGQVCPRDLSEQLQQYLRAGNSVNEYIGHIEAEIDVESSRKVSPVRKLELADLQKEVVLLKAARAAAARVSVSELLNELKQMR